MNICIDCGDARPFSSEVPRIEEQQEVRMEFPAEDESTGAICELCWQGPGTEIERIDVVKIFFHIFMNLEMYIDSSIYILGLKI